MIQREKIIPIDVESNNTTKKASCFTYVDNIPFMAILGIILSIASTCISFLNFPKCQSTLEKYVATSSTMVNMQYFVVYLLLVHVGVFMHSVAVSALETSREVCHSTTIGCECCPSTCQKISRKTCNAIWAIVGTTAMFFQYAGCIAFFSLSSTSTLVSFVMKETCVMYETLIEEYIQKAENYILSAKTLLGQTNNMTMQVLSQYNEMMALQQSYQNTAFKQMEKVRMGPSLVEERSFGNERFPERYLSSSFNPVSAIESGQDTLAVLNQTIANVEGQLDVYKNHLSQTVVFCNDYGGLYTYLFEITIAAGLFLVAHFILYARHQKNFTVWFYEEKYFR